MAVFDDIETKDKPDYDKGEVSQREKKAGQNQVAISDFDKRAVDNQVKQQQANYDFANRQNRALADVQRIQNSRSASTDRFNAHRDLMNSLNAVANGMGAALNGSGASSFMRLANDRNDRDNTTYWQQLQENQDKVENAYDEAVNQNNVSKNDAAISGQKAIADIESQLAANLNNINPALFIEPGTGHADLGSGTTGAAPSLGDASIPFGQAGAAQLSGYAGSNFVKENQPTLSTYLNPDNAAAKARAKDTSGGQVSSSSGVGNYFSRLVNMFNSNRR